MLLMKAAVRKSQHEFQSGEMSMEEKSRLFNEIQRLGLYSQWDEAIPLNKGAATQIDWCCLRDPVLQAGSTCCLPRFNSQQRPEAQLRRPTR